MDINLKDIDIKYSKLQKFIIIKRVIDGAIKRKSRIRKRRNKRANFCQRIRTNLAEKYFKKLCTEIPPKLYVGIYSVYAESSKE